tara:strand:+ start:10 stop:648 length:639 start_codon:yes stop_codon:yes gene_type:complete
MIMVALGCQLIAGVILDLLGHLDPLSSSVMGILVWTVIPATFLGLGLVKWPERRASPSRRQLLIVGCTAIALAAAFSFTVVALETDRWDYPSVGVLAGKMAGVLVLASAEEVVFRVLLLTALLSATRSRGDALILASSAFALGHAPLALIQPIVHADWTMLAYAATEYAPAFVWQMGFGLLLGALWMRTGSIAIVAGTHAIINVGHVWVPGV